VRIVIADTGPPHYLVLIGKIELLPQLFGTVHIPEIVRDELSHARTPAPIRDWLATNPAWLKTLPTLPAAASPLPELGRGERAAIALAGSLGADLILMDDRSGVAAATALGFETTGTLGIVGLAARRGLIDLADAFARLKATNFRYQPKLLDALLAEHRKRK
jgi:predicted nucleic acid-binding protein